MLRKCDRFRPGTNFHSWSTSIAYLEVLKYRSSKKRQSPGLSEATLEMLSAEALNHALLLGQRNAALPECMEKLPPGDLSLVSDHYFRGLSWETIAKSLGRSSSSVRHSVCRIRRELKRCIDAVVGAKKGTGTVCAKHPEGRSGKRCLSPFSRRRTHDSFDRQIRRLVRPVGRPLRRVDIRKRRRPARLSPAGRPGGATGILIVSRRPRGPWVDLGQTARFIFR